MAKWWVIVAIAALVATPGEAQSGRPPIIDLQITNEARVPTALLEGSQSHVEQILAGAGLEVRWTDTRPRFRVTIVPQVLGYDRAQASVMGVALPAGDGSVQIFFRQVADFARTYHVELGTMLGHVIAHEVGHLLLASAAHSPQGVMQAHWDKTIVRDMAAGTLTFTNAQAARIRASH